MGRKSVMRMPRKMGAVISSIAALVTLGAVSGQDSTSNRPAVIRAPHSYVSAPKLLHKVEPEYSEEAQRAGIQGTVVLYGEVAPDLLAHNLRVIRSMGHGLDERAIEAVIEWQFRPGEKDGKPVTGGSDF